MLHLKEKKEVFLVGFFDVILHGCGFEEEVRQHTAVKPRRKLEEAKNPYDYFNLHQKQKKEETLNTTLNMVNSNLFIYEPKSQEEVQKIILSLKLEQACIVNLANIARGNNMRVLDFFSGAVFALGGEINRIQGDLFLVTPKNVQIKRN